MKTYRFVSAIAVPAIGIWVLPLLVFGLATANAQTASDVGGQVLTRGPIHEAFAEAPMYGAAAGAVITKAPRFPITELPPDQRPEGANVAWIPGYWGWDDDRTDYIWVSGVWRDVPPGRQWVPGYWGGVEGGSRWVSGFWGDVAQTEVTYLPSPPEPLELGPNAPTPGPGNVWTSGSWVWQQNRYDWQPGYWVAQQPDWVWTPARYTWTPRGYVYVPGFWDYEIAHRGVMFAPVYYDQPVYMGSSYSYRPNTVIDLVAILAGLFVQPRSNHYYYGDYYDARYEERGYQPWHSRQSSQYGFDPIFAHYRSSQLRNDPNWDTHADELFRYRRDHVDARPPQTLALQVNFNYNQTPAGVANNLLIGRSFADAIQSKTLPQRFTPVNVDERKRIEDRGRKVRKLEFERARVEALPKVAEVSEGASEKVRVIKEQLPVSPVAATAEIGDGEKAPPPVPVAPKPQVAEGKTRKAKPENVEAKAKQKAVNKSEQKANQKAAATDEAQQEEPLVKPAKLESTSQSQGEEPKPAKRKVAPVKVKAKSGAPSAIETPAPRKDAANRQVKSSKPAQNRGNAKAVEAKGKSGKTEAPKAEVSSQELEPAAAQSSQSDTKIKESKREQTPNKANDKIKKSDKG